MPREIIPSECWRRWEQTSRLDGLSVTVGDSEINCVDVDVPGDISSAAFWIVAGLSASECGDCDQRASALNPTRAGVVTALLDMGANIELVDERDVAGEPVADIVARTSNLRGTELAGSIMPLMMDEVPIDCGSGCDGRGRDGDSGCGRVAGQGD